MRIVFVRHASYSEIHQCILPDYLPILDRLGKKLAGLLGKFYVASSDASRAVKTAEMIARSGRGTYNQVTWAELGEHDPTPVPKLLTSFAEFAKLMNEEAIVAVTHAPRLRAIHDYLMEQSADDLTGRGLGYAEAYVLDLEAKSIKKLSVRRVI